MGRCCFLFFFLLSFSLSASEPLERDVYLMGTSFHVSLFENDETKGLRQIESMVQSVEDTEAQLSTWRDSSELSRINQQAIDSDFRMSPSLCALMSELKSHVLSTGGAFDPTVGQILRAWKIQSGFRIADQASVTVAVRKTGFSHLEMQNCFIRKAADVLFDAGAFGKGEALDRVLNIAARDHYAPLVLDFGGQIAVWNLREPLPITLSDPANRRLVSNIRIKIATGSLSTSAGSEHDGHINGRTIGHIVDPRTGYPVPSFGSVTVWHERALDADILSTALYVMGPEKGLSWAEENKIAACFLFRNRRKPEMTSAFRKMLVN